MAISYDSETYKRLRPELESLTPLSLITDVDSISIPYGPKFKIYPESVHFPHNLQGYQPSQIPFVSCLYYYPVLPLFFPSPKVSAIASVNILKDSVTPLPKIHQDVTQRKKVLTTGYKALYDSPTTMILCSLLLPLNFVHFAPINWPPCSSSSTPNNSHLRTFTRFSD